MRPGYEERIRSYKGGSTKTTTIRVPKRVMEELNLYAQNEGDAEAGLIREGLLRVIDDRRNDAEYMAAINPDILVNLQGAAQERVDHLQAELMEARAELGVFVTEQPG